MLNNMLVYLPNVMDKSMIPPFNPFTIFEALLRNKRLQFLHWRFIAVEGMHEAELKRKITVVVTNFGIS
jgi:hypothetical protein